MRVGQSITCHLRPSSNGVRLRTKTKSIWPALDASDRALHEAQRLYRRHTLQANWHGTSFHIQFCSLFMQLSPKSPMQQEGRPHHAVCWSGQHVQHRAGTFICQVSQTKWCTVLPTNLSIKWHCWVPYRLGWGQNLANDRWDGPKKVSYLDHDVYLAST